MKNYLENFPIKSELLPKQLIDLLSPVTNINSPELMIEITKRFGKPAQEYCHMIMATVPENKINRLKVTHSICNGVVSYSEPCCNKKGGLAKISYSLDGYDYLVASWGAGSFYTYNLSEKVWMTLGLSQRCIGNDDQRVVYDDLSEPVMVVAEGEISNEFHWVQSRDVIWKMRNDYLRYYLWMRSHVAVRYFYYEKLIADTPEIRAIMGNRSHYTDAPENSWYELHIREHWGQLLLQVKAAVPAVTPTRFKEQSIYELIWPGDSRPMDESRISSFLNSNYPAIYLKDDFLIKYEGNSVYDTVPVIDPDGRVYCNPSYKGQWSFAGLQRVGRNILMISTYELYSKSPDHGVLHAYKYAISPEEAICFDQKEENIVNKTNRLVKSLLALGDLLCNLASNVEILNSSEEKYVGLSSININKNGWRSYPIINKLARAAPVNISEDTFLSKCKTLVEFLRQIKTGPLKCLLIKAGDSRDALRDFKSLKLLQRIKNILDYLINNQEAASSWINAANSCSLDAENTSLAALFIANELRTADSHEKIKEYVVHLEKLGFDSAKLGNGYGYALDFVYDRVIESIESINQALKILLANG